MSIDTGTGLTYNPAYPVAGITQSSQPFRDNFAIVQAAVQSLELAANTVDSVLTLSTNQAMNGTITYGLNFPNNSFVLPVSPPSVSATVGMIQTASGLLQVFDGSVWRSSVSSVAVSMPTDIFAVGGSPVTTAGTLAFTKSNIAANLFLAGPSSGAAGPWTMRLMALSDLPLVGAASGLATLDSSTHIPQAQMPVATVRTVRAATVGTSSTSMTASDFRLNVTNTFGAPITVILPATPAIGFEVIVKDVIGSAATFNMTLSPNGGTIDGSSTLVMNVNFQSVHLSHNGANVWSVI